MKTLVVLLAIALQGCLQSIPVQEVAKTNCENLGVADDKQCLLQESISVRMDRVQEKQRMQAWWAHRSEVKRDFNQVHQQQIKYQQEWHKQSRDTANQQFWQVQQYLGRHPAVIIER